jgi:hypothetical protein
MSAFRASEPKKMTIIVAILAAARLKRRVLILVLAIGFCLVCTAVTGIAQGDDARLVVMRLPLVTAALGYWGSAARLSLSQTRPRPDWIGAESPAV